MENTGKISTQVSTIEQLERDIDHLLIEHHGSKKTS